MKITILEAGKKPYSITLDNFEDLHRIKLTDEERYHIVTLYHQAFNKAVYKNAEVTVGTTTYAVGLIIAALQVELRDPSEVLGL